MSYANKPAYCDEGPTRQDINARVASLLTRVHCVSHELLSGQGDLPGYTAAARKACAEMVELLAAGLVYRFPEAPADWLATVAVNPVEEGQR